MKSGFHDPIAARPGKSKKAPFAFQQPEYDDRSSCYVNAGSHYGVGHKQPVGHTGNPKERVSVLPYGKHKGMEVDRVESHSNLPLEMDA